MSNKLTIKQEKFCQVYIETGNASEAYRRAYDASGMKPNTVEKRACELLKNGKVAGRVRELASAHAQRHEITIDKLTEMLVHAYKLAMKKEVASPSAAVSATLGLGKLHQLIVEKKQIAGDINHKHTHHLEPSETDAWINKVLGSETQAIH